MDEPKLRFPKPDPVIPPEWLELCRQIDAVTADITVAKANGVFSNSESQSRAATPAAK